MSDNSPDSVTASVGAAPSAPSEGCPTPLAWRDVLAAFRSERDEFSLQTSWGDVQLWEFGQGTPLLCLGPAAGDADLFALAAWLLREDYRCLLVTLPVPPVEVPSTAWLGGMAELVDRVLSARSCDRVPVLATGHGCVLALQTALDIPARVGRLVLHASPLGMPMTWRERMLLRIGSRRRGPLANVPTYLSVTESNHRRWFPPFDPSRWEFLRDNLAQTSTQRFARTVLAAAETQIESRLHALDSPVLLVRSEGEGARLTTAQEQLARELPNVHVEWMHTAGHFPHVTHPHRLVKLLRDFLAPGDNPQA
ncbi:MAG: alpha/beta hydrolase [Planctomycetaceae bacterium]|nr:alpha/beta hydrolase [Planctomycetaceae bacterium]